MKPKTAAKIFVEPAMLVLYLILTFNYSANTLFHEVAGIGIGALFAVHVALNWKSVKNMMKAAKQGRLRPMRTILLVSDLVLPFGMAACIGTGMLIAHDLYIGPGGPAIAYIHNTAAYICLGIMLFHTALHAKYLAGVFKQLSRTSFAQKTAACTGALLMVGALLGTDVLVGAQDRLNAALTADVAQAAQTTTTSTGSTTATVNDRSSKNRTSSSSSSTSSSTTSSTSSSASTSSSTDSSSVSSSTDTSSTSNASQGTSTSATNSTTSVMHCSLCPKNCPITALQCAKGTNWATTNGYI